MEQPKKRINSRQKGARGERMFRDQIRESGMDAIRGQQFSGGADSPDVKCDSLPNIHFEVKFGKIVPSGIYDFLAQAVRDAGEYKTPVVAVKRDNCEWLMIMQAQPWLNAIKQSEHFVPGMIKCPNCSSLEIVKNGKGRKIEQWYICQTCKKNNLSYNFSVK